jgi:hypothetical protein
MVMASNRGWCHDLGERICGCLTSEGAAWVIWQGLPISLYILYGLGSYVVENVEKMQSGQSVSWTWTVPAWYGGTAVILTFCCLWPLVLICRRRFRSHQVEEGSRRQLQKSLLWNFAATTVVLFATLVSQVCLIWLVYQPGHTKLWAVSFVFISSALAAFGCYFFIGDPGMANLESLDKRLKRRTKRQALARPLPEAFVRGLEAELAVLRGLTTGLVALYVAVGAGVVLGLDNIAALFGREHFWGPANAGVANAGVANTGVSDASAIWFIIGVVFLLGGCHASITGAVYGRYYRIAQWLRRSGMLEW